tara:strand:- start:194 stop:910 length:717 start_codon:yes stop_codon:yes gene_type:complete
MTRARELAKLSNQETLKIDTTNTRIGIGSTAPSSSLNVGLGITMDGPSGVITATSFVGDGSGLDGVASAGLGTGLSSVDGNFLNKVYYTNKTLTLGVSTTVEIPSTSDAHAAYISHEEVAINADKDLTIADGDDLILDVLGISTVTTTTNPLSGVGGRLRAAYFTNKAGTGAPELSYGVSVPTGMGITGAGGVNVSGAATVSGGFVSAASTSACKITFSGQTLTFNVPGVGSTSFTLY